MTAIRRGIPQLMRISDAELRECGAPCIANISRCTAQIPHTLKIPLYSLSLLLVVFTGVEPRRTIVD